MRLSIAVKHVPKAVFLIHSSIVDSQPPDSDDTDRGRDRGASVIHEPGAANERPDYAGEMLGAVEHSAWSSTTLGRRELHTGRNSISSSSNTSVCCETEAQRL